MRQFISFDNGRGGFWLDEYLSHSVETSFSTGQQTEVVVWTNTSFKGGRIWKYQTTADANRVASEITNGIKAGLATQTDSKP